MDNQQPSNNSLFYKKPQIGYGFIYKYTSPSKRSYIGQTVNSLASRAKSIVSGAGYKKCSIFWKAIQKYSFSNFSAEILCEVPVDELNRWEEYYISFYNTIAPNGYNLCEGGEGGKKKEVYVYSAQNGKFLEHYSSLSEAASMTQVPIETISSIMSAKSKRRQAHNLVFCNTYYENFNTSKLSRDNYKRVYVYDESGNFLKEFESISSASNYLKVSESTIRRRVEDGKISCGFYFSNIKEEKEITPVRKTPKKGKAVCQISPIDYETIKVYPSLSAAARAVGLSSCSNISRAASKRIKAGGYFWRIIEGSTTKTS